MTLYIIKGNAPALFGRDWLQEIRMNWEGMLMKVEEKKNDKLVSARRHLKKMKRYSEMN